MPITDDLNLHDEAAETAEQAISIGLMSGQLAHKRMNLLNLSPVQAEILGLGNADVFEASMELPLDLFEI